MCTISQKLAIFVTGKGYLKFRQLLIGIVIEFYYGVIITIIVGFYHIRLIGYLYYVCEKCVITFLKLVSCKKTIQ